VPRSLAQIPIQKDSCIQPEKRAGCHCQPAERMSETTCRGSAALPLSPPTSARRLQPNTESDGCFAIPADDLESWLPCGSRNDPDPGAAFLKIKDRVGGISLRKEGLLWSQLDNFASPAGVAQKRHRIESVILKSSHKGGLITDTAVTREVGEDTQLQSAAVHSAVVPMNMDSSAIIRTAYRREERKRESRDAPQVIAYTGTCGEHTFGGCPFLHILDEMPSDLRESFQSGFALYCAPILSERSCSDGARPFRLVWGYLLRLNAH